MSKPVTNVAIIIETGGPVPTNVQTTSIHTQAEIEQKYRNALVDWFADKPAFVKIESGDDSSSVVLFPVASIKMISIAVIQAEGRIKLLNRDEVIIPKIDPNLKIN